MKLVNRYRFIAVKLASIVNNLFGKDFRNADGLYRLVMPLGVIGLEVFSLRMGVRHRSVL